MARPTPDRYAADATLWRYPKCERVFATRNQTHTCGDLHDLEHQRSGEQAKRVADAVARRVIEWSNAPRPTSLRHDAAEAILIGLWRGARRLAEDPAGRLGGPPLAQRKS